MRELLQMLRSRYRVGAPAAMVGPVQVPLFDPATLPLSGWWRAGSSFSAGTWTGTASAGSSGSRNLTESTNPPSAGAALNGITTVDFDGVNDILGASFDKSALWSASAGSMVVLMIADTVSADNPGAPYNNKGIWMDSAGADLLSVSSAGLFAAIYSGGYVSINIPYSVGAWVLVQTKFDGANFKARKNNGSWTTSTAGSLTFPSQPFHVGENYAGGSFFDGRIAELMFTNTTLADSDFDNIRSYINNRYALSV